MTKLQRTILEIVAKGDPPLTAQGVTSRVRKIIPTADRPAVLTDLRRLVLQAKITHVYKPYMPSRFKLTGRVK